ncbi:MAG: tetratricopeptide repeat protein [Acidobacteriota bacterium]|nr:tetratricopeptide repeat protein [Acidobacteriota bacterium]
MRASVVHAILLVAGTAVAPAAAAQKQAAAAAPDTPSYYFLLARHLESGKKVDEAIDALKKAIALSPDSAELRAELAGVYARQDRAKEALEAAEAALERDPASREANRILGSIYAALSEQRQPLRPGDDPASYKVKAAAALEKSRRETGVDLNLELMLGRLYLQSASYETAIGSLRRVVDAQPGYPEAAMLLSAAQEGAGRADEAIRTLETTLRESPEFFRGHVRLAELYERQRRFREAADAYGQAQAANSRADVTPRHAASLINAGKPAEARDLLQGAMARKTPPDASLLYMLGQSQRLLKDLDGASTTAQKLKAAFPNDTRASYLDAQILNDRGNKAEAIAAFQDLVKRSPENSSLVLEYANLLDKAGRLDEAEGALRELVAKDPLDANALNSLGYLLAEHGRRLDEAVELVRRALRVEPGNPSFLDSLGWAYYQQGNLELADSPLTEAAAKVPDNSVIQDHLGDLRFKQQRFAEAAAAWERALAGDGDSIERSVVEQKIRGARSRVAP